MGRVLILTLIPIGLFLFGWATGRMTQPKESLAKDQLRELDELRRLRDHLYMQAGQHVALGDNFALIAMDEINASREKEIEK